MLGDVGSASGLAWLGAGAAALMLLLGIAVGSPGPVHAAVVLLGAIFLARHDLRLLLAPVYGAGLLLLEDLAIQSIELRGVELIAPEVIGARTLATILAAATGASAAAAAALLVTVAPGRSIELTALAGIAAVAAFAAIALFARDRYGARRGSA